MSRWFRFYSGVVDDPKAQMLSPEMFKHWVNVLCIAAQHDGELPAISVTAFTLRLPEPKAAGILAKLHAAGLLDKTDKSFKPHNWDGRQYKHDVTDATNADRQKRYRNRKRNGESNGVTPVTAKRPDSTDTDNRFDDAGAAREPLVSEQASGLAEQLLVIAGHDPKFWPPGWCGAPMRVQSWISEGWQPEIIVAAVTAAARKKRGAPASSVQFFENAIAEEVARQAAPLPKVEVREAETLTVTHGKPKNGIIQAADDLVRKLASFDGPARGPDELRSVEGQATTRLLSHG